MLFVNWPYVCVRLQMVKHIALSWTQSIDDGGDNNKNHTEK